MRAMQNRNPESPWNPGTAVEVTPEEYERQVLRWLQGSLGNKIGLRVKHRAKVAGEAGEYELDVVVELSLLGGALIVVLVECKRYKSPVERDKILALHAKLNDTGAHKGIMFATAGFQRGALEYAKTHGVATVSFIDGKATYETRSAGPAPEPPSWVNLPRFAGIYMDLEQGTIRCRLVEDGRLDAFTAWLAGSL
jgi:restriction system protein